MSKVAVLMTCHNRVETTLKCLDGLAANAENETVDVWLVDDGSTDGTSERVKSWHRQNADVVNLTVVAGSGNLYWAKGMALAWRSAAISDYDFYLWLNDDVALYPEALSGLLNDYRKVGGVIVGACCEPGGGAISYGATDAMDRKIVPKGTPQKADGWLNGNFVLVPREVYRKVGMISDEYTHARADYDYAERLKRTGIPFYSSSKFVGECHYEFDAKIRGKSLWQRIRLLWRPGYWNLHDLWLIRSRYHGKLRALVSCVHLIVIAVRYKSK